MSYDLNQLVHDDDRCDHATCPYCEAETCCYPWETTDEYLARTRSNDDDSD